ncbi:hypothetical protein GCM10027414_07150 [Humibacter ginsengiterrae]
MTATVIGVQPLFMNNVSFVVDTDEFAAAISSVTFTPSTKNVTFQGGTPDASFTFPTPATWTADLEFAQDWTTPNSLSFYLYNNAGTTKSVTFLPVAGGATITATLVIAEGAVGGAIGTAVPTAKVSLGVNGRPVITPAAV